MIRTLAASAALALAMSVPAAAETCEEAHAECSARAKQVLVTCGDPTSDCSKDYRKQQLACDDALFRCKTVQRDETPSPALPLAER